MPIEAQCPGCAKTYRVKEDQAGKRVKCPQCGGAIEVPRPTLSAAVPSPSRLPPLKQPERWFLTTARGEQFGPVPKSELDSWVADGSVDDQCLVLKEGDTDWVFAIELYPELAEYQIQDAPPPTAVAQRADYRRLLSYKQEVSSMIRRMLDGECTKNGLTISRSAVYQVGEMRTWWEQAKHSATFGPFAQTKSIHVDYLNTFRVSTPRGEIHVVLPMDGAMPCPVEFAAVVPGRLPESVALVRGRGSNRGVDLENSMAGAFVPGPVTALLKATGGTAESLWVTTAGRDDHPLLRSLEQTNLHAGARWDGQMSMGNARVTYRLSWAVQAMPLDANQFLLVAKNVPKNRMLMGFDLNVEWFVQLRDAFGYLCHNNTLPGDGQRRILDPGNWYAYAVEVMGLAL